MADTTLSEPRRRLLEIIRTIGFGRIENLVVSGGEPVVGPQMQVYYDRKFGIGAGDQGAAGRGMSTEKNHVRDLLRELDRFGDGEIAYLDIQDGLPSRMRIRAGRPS